MSSAVYLEDPAGRRRLLDADFPLGVGGPGAAVPLPGIDASGAVAWFGRSEGELFVQSSDGATPVTCNGSPVRSSQWLRPGDVVRIGPAEVRVEPDPDGIRLQVLRLADENATEPPVIAPREPHAEPATGSTTVTPVAFKPRPLAGAPRRSWTLRPGPLVLWVVLAGLAAAAWFLFSLRSVQIEIDPAPEQVTLRGGPFHWEVGGQHLMRPGRYLLLAERAGYLRLEVALEVTGDGSQEFLLELEELPGVLHIDVGLIEGAEVIIDGTTVGITPLTPHELARGDHDVRIRAPRYEEHTAPITIQGLGAEQTLAVELVPRWAPVVFQSRPEGATVQVDGERVGRTPMTADLLAGDHRYELTLAGHKPYRGSVKVVARQAQTTPLVTLKLLDARLTLKSHPDGATVTVDGTYRGRTPLELILTPDSAHEIALSKSGHESHSQEVRLGSGETDGLEIRLAPRVGDVEVAAEPSDAALFVNGEARGPASQTLHLAAVPHQIEIRKEGFESYRITVTPRPGFPQSIRVSLKTTAQVQAEVTPALVKNPQDQDMVLIRGGRFEMGASRREPGRRANETINEFELTRPFYLSTMEVSNGDFRKYEEGHLSGQVGGYNLEFDHHPVVRVTWEEAAAYCNWLSDQAGLPPFYKRENGRTVPVQPTTVGYRLPTETEWAWAARFADGGDPEKFPWGQALPVPPGAGNYADVSAAELIPNAIRTYDDNYPITAPVDSFSPNPLGLFNMGGNVAEWVHDIYTIYPSGSGGVARDPLGPTDGELHVIRGSSWMDYSVSDLRLTYRDYGKNPRPDVGFRVARYAE